MATRYNDLFGGGISSILDGMNFVRDWKKEQNRLTQYDDEADIREKKRLEAEEALRFWGLDNVSASREAKALGDANRTLWTEDTMGRIMAGVTPQDAASSNIATTNARLGLDIAKAGVTRSEADAVSSNPVAFSPAQLTLAERDIGLGGQSAADAFNKVLGRNVVVPTDDGRYKIGDLTVTKSELPTLYRSAIAGVVDKQVAAQRLANADNNRQIAQDAKNPATEKSAASVSDLSKISDNIATRLQEDRRMPEDERQQLIQRKQLIDGLIDEMVGIPSRTQNIDLPASTSSITSPSTVAPLSSAPSVAPAAPVPATPSAPSSFQTDADGMRIKAIEDSIAGLTSQLRVAASRSNSQLQNELTARIARMTGELNRIKQR